MKTVLFLLLVASIGMSACTKDELRARDTDDTSSTSPGELRGSITPIGAAKEIVIYSRDQNGLTYSAILDKNNNFVFSALESDNYMLRIIPHAGYAAPLDTLIRFNSKKGLLLPLKKISKLADVGKVIGRVGTADAVSVVTIFQAPGTYSGIPLSFSATPDPSTGDFVFSDVPVGNYNLNFSTRSGFIKQEDRNIDVKSRVNTDVGSITFVFDQVISRIAFKALGNTFDWVAYASLPSSRLYTYAASYTGASLSITASSVTGNIQIGRYGRDRRLHIKIDNVNGPGTYRCEGTATSDMSYSDSATGPMQGYVYKYNTTIAGSSAVVIITDIDPIAKIVRGSFSGTLKALGSSGSIAELDITEGRFEIPYN